MSDMFDEFTNYVKDERKRRQEIETKYFNLKKTMFYVCVPVITVAAIYLFFKYVLRRFV